MTWRLAILGHPVWSARLIGFGIDFILAIFRYIDISILKHFEVSILILFRGIDFNFSFDTTILIVFLLWISSNQVYIFYCSKLDLVSNILCDLSFKVAVETRRITHIGWPTSSDLTASYTLGHPVWSCNMRTPQWARPHQRLLPRRHVLRGEDLEEPRWFARVSCVGSCCTDEKKEAGDNEGGLIESRRQGILMITIAI